jgi:hypothetical protein
MRLLSPLLFVLLIAFKAAPAQKSPAKEPFIIRGQLMNFTEKDLMFFFRDPETGLKDHTIETVTVDSMGRFYLKTYAISGPTRATLRKGDFSVDVYAAQGYNLTLTGDVWIFLSKVRHDSSESTPLIPGQSTPPSRQQSSGFWRASM